MRHPASWSKSPPLSLGDWKEMGRGSQKRRLVPHSRALGILLPRYRPRRSDPPSIRPTAEHRDERRDSNAFQKEPCKTAGKRRGMRETRPEAGEIIPSSRGQKRKWNIMSFSERGNLCLFTPEPWGGSSPSSASAAVLCCHFFFFLGFLVLFPLCI